MIQMFYNGALLYDLRNPSYVLDGPKCELEVNKTGSLSFRIAPTHPLYGSLQKLRSEITIYQDGEWLAAFRILNVELDFNNMKTVSCEGELSYLLDSIQRSVEYNNISVPDYFAALIANHNADVDTGKQFKVGNITVSDANGSLYRCSSFESTWDTIQNQLLDKLGGYVRTYRKEGIRLIDYITDYGNINTQVFHFGENIFDLTRDIRCEDIATVLIPLGAKDEETEECLTIMPVNDGLDYIEDTEAIADYGRIIKTIEFNDISDASDLLKKGYEQLAEWKHPVITLTLTAIDLHLIDVSIERIKIGDSIRVISEPHGLDEYMMVKKLSLDFQHPENSKITLGTTRKTLNAVITSDKKEAWANILTTQQSLKETLSSVKVTVQECYSEISKTAEEIKSTISEEYLSKSELETIQQDFQSSITQNSSEVRMDFVTITNDIINTVSANQTLLEEYIRFKGALIELGKVGNAFTAELSNEELAFKENSQRIAYISNQQLVITNAEILNKLSLGNGSRGWFDFIPRTSGNLSIKWRDPVS